MNSKDLPSDTPRSITSRTDEPYFELNRPKVGKLLKMLKLDKAYVSAEGDWMIYQDERGVQSVLDLLGGYGSTLLGHNHSELIAAMKRTLDSKVAIHGQASIRTKAGELAVELNRLISKHTSDRRTFITTLCSTGTEATEAAIKHALMEWSEKKSHLTLEIAKRRGRTIPEAHADEALDRLRAAKPCFLAMEGSFHGKTAASMSVTSNPEFKKMYGRNAVETIFVDPRLAESLEAAFRSQDVDLNLPGIPAWSNLAGAIFEPIQGEGGIVPMDEGFAAVLKSQASQRNVPLIADEIQTGLFRTGSLLASEEYGLKPDYILLGKGLGGGLTKVAALLVASEHYQEDFGYLHTSTFAEDDLSSSVAIETLGILDRSAEEIAARASAVEEQIRKKVLALQESYPEVIREVAGRGFMLGIRFNFTPEAPISVFLDTIQQSGFASYVYASYLLNQHNIRVGVTLSRPDTIRVEPSVLISDSSIAKFLYALEELVRCHAEGKLLKLTHHFWHQELSSEELETVSKPRKAWKRPSPPIRKVAFLSHIIDDRNLQLCDPLFRVLKQAERERFMGKFGATTGPVLYHDQLIESASGERIHLHVYGLFLPTVFFENSLRQNDSHAYRLVEKMASRAVEDGCSILGLGQYTSIVSDNGQLLRGVGARLTTGNSLTAGFAWKGLQKALEERGKSWDGLKVGVIGAAGNICNVMSQLIADQAGSMTLVFREGTLDSPRSHEAVQSIVTNSRISPEKIKATSDLESLRDCDAIVIGTNTSKQFLLPDHLMKDAVVLDISVPSNVDSRVLTERQDVKCFVGGMAKLPGQQFLESSWVPLAKGEVFACMGETICMGLKDHPEHLSLGALNKKQVLETLELANDVGMTVGSLRSIR